MWQHRSHGIGVEPAPPPPTTHPTPPTHPPTKREKEKERKREREKERKREREKRKSERKRKREGEREREKKHMPYVSTFVAMTALETSSVERHERQMEWTTPEQVQILHGKNSLQEFGEIGDGVASGVAQSTALYSNDGFSQKIRWWSLTGRAPHWHTLIRGQTY